MRRENNPHPRPLDDRLRDCGGKTRLVSGDTQRPRGDCWSFPAT